MKIDLSCLCFFVGFFLMSAGCQTAEANVFTVSNGNIAALKAAMNSANSNGADDIILLAGSGTYTLVAVDNIDPSDNVATGLPIIASDNHHSLTISGNGSTLQRGTGVGVPEFRLLRLGSGASLVINALTMVGGIAHGGTKGGGGILNESGTLVMNGCVMNNNAALAIYVNDTTLGGAISGGVTATNCTFAGNSATGITPPNGSTNRGSYAYGGAIYGYSELTNCVFNSNSCTAGNGSMANPGFTSGSGGVAGGGAVTDVDGITGCTFTGNTCQGGAGGAAPSNGQMGSAGFADGGAVSGAKAIVDCSFSSNTVIGAAGTDQSTGTSKGGAVSLAADCSVLGSSFMNDSAQGPNGGGGAIYARGTSMTLQIRNCTFASNSATARGGAIYGDTPTSVGEYRTDIYIYNCTLSGNNSPFGGGVYSAGNSIISFANSIFKTGSTGASVAGNFNISQGHNITDDAGGMTGNRFNGPGDMINTNPLFITSSPSENGGRTKTLALFFTSPAIDHAAEAYATRRDQRGNFRSGQCDIGAFEYQGGLVGWPGILRSGNNIIVSAEVAYGHTYRLQRSSNLAAGSWQTINGVDDFVATGNDIESVTDTSGISPGRVFYHIVAVQ